MPTSQDALKHMQSMRPGQILCSWRIRASMGRADFFLFADCVMYQSWTHAEGWQVSKVPEGGLEL